MGDTDVTHLLPSFIAIIIIIIIIIVIIIIYFFLVRRPLMMTSKIPTHAISHNICTPLCRAYGALFIQHSLAMQNTIMHDVARAQGVGGQGESSSTTTTPWLYVQGWVSYFTTAFA